ncbi:amino acid ABC transporter permease [Afifella pfennigii]|uniref:amino acid ABC transporter permease n=1 Tax=Afifella pfennigii TaxID=209897 RepID=UPI00047E9598|nr:amino acid ABC transporter permease [Afifella pfennigii]
MTFDLNALQADYPLLFEGLLVTLRIVGYSIVFGAIGSVVLCMGKLSGKGPGYRVAVFIIDFFRTIPEVVLIFWVYSCLPLLFGLRMSAEVSGVVALSLFVAANVAEILRAGILSTDRGQLEAAFSLGTPVTTIWRRIVLPPALRRMLPNFVNFLTELLKASSLLSTIGVAEMVYQATVLGNETFAYLEFLTAVAVLYFLLIFPLSLYVRYAEGRHTKRISR